MRGRNAKSRSRREAPGTCEQDASTSQLPTLVLPRADAQLVDAHEGFIREQLRLESLLATIGVVSVGERRVVSV